jgi:hypothetical protein
VSWPPDWPPETQWRRNSVLALQVFEALTQALAPFGMGPHLCTLQLWEDAYVRGIAMFTQAGCFEPGRVEALARAVRLMQELTPPAREGEDPGRV